MHLFYLFRTQNDNIYKFGMSSRDNNRKTRLTEYCGLNQPKKIFIEKYVKDGYNEEHYFKEFLRYRGISIIYGNEFFKFDGGIEILIIDYEKFDKKKCRSPKTRTKEDNTEKQIRRSNKQRKLTLSGGKMFSCYLCDYVTNIKGNLIHQHNKSFNHKRNDLLFGVD